MLNQLTVTLAFVAAILTIILIVIWFVVVVDFKKIIKRIRKRSWE